MIFLTHMTAPGTDSHLFFKLSLADSELTCLFGILRLLFWETRIFKRVRTEEIKSTAQQLSSLLVKLSLYFTVINSLIG